MQTATIRGITITFSPNNVVTQGTYWDGEPWILANGPITVTGWTPAMTGGGTDNLQNGGMLNMRGTINHVQGFDGRSAYDNHVPTNVNLPVTMVAGDVLVVGTSGVGNGAVPRPGYFPSSHLGRSYIDYMLTLSVVDSIPSPTSFRPNAQGNPASRQRASHNDIIWSRLPSSISSAHPNAPAISECETIFGAYMGDVLGGWTSDQIAPNFQHPGYGSYFSSALSESLLMACSDLTVSAKTLLVKRLIQAGIDLWGAFRDGRTTYANGGHLQGRKALVIFAGHMLGDEAMANPDVTLGASPPKFREQIAHYQNGTDAWQGWRQRWTYNFGADGTNLASTYETTNPSTWGATGTNDAMFYDHYHGLSTHGSAVGQAIVMGLIGRVRHWGINMFASIWWHMTTPTEAMLTATSRTPEKFEYWHVVPRPNGGTIGPEYALGYSYRGGGGGVFQSGHWPLAMVIALRPNLTYATAIGLGSTSPVAVIFDDPQYGVAMQVECVWATPGQASRIWWGEVDSLPETDAQMWAAGSANANVPNAYGYHRNSLTIPVVSNTVAHEAGWAVAIVYDLGGGSYISTPLILLDIPTPVAQIEP